MYLEWNIIGSKRNWMCHRNLYTLYSIFICFDCRPKETAFSIGLLEWKWPKSQWDTRFHLILCLIYSQIWQYFPDQRKWFFIKFDQLLAKLQPNCKWRYKIKFSQRLGHEWFISSKNVLPLNIIYFLGELLYLCSYRSRSTNSKLEKNMIEGK